MKIDRFADGGVTVTIPQDADNLFAGMMPWMALAIVSVVAGAMILAREPDAQLGVIVICGTVVALAAFRITYQVTRFSQPLVIGVSPRGVYIDDPRRLVQRRKYLRRDDVQIVQPVRYRRYTRGGGRVGPQRYCLEIQIAFQQPRRLLDGEISSDVFAASDALRQALWPDKPKVEVKEK